MTANLPPEARDLAALKRAFATHGTRPDVAAVRTDLLCRHRDGRLDAGTVTQILSWLNGLGRTDGFESERPSLVGPEFRKGQVVINADGNLVKLYLAKSGRLYGKVQNGDEWVYTAGAMRGVRHLTAAEAKAYGDATDHCVFCGRALEDDRSTTVGYGPTCAARYALPWGGK